MLIFCRVFILVYRSQSKKSDGQPLVIVWAILFTYEFIVFIIVVGWDCVNTKDGIVFRLVPVLLWKSASWCGPRKANALFDQCWIEGEKTWLALKERMNEREGISNANETTNINFFIYSIFILILYTILCLSQMELFKHKKKQQSAAVVLMHSFCYLNWKGVHFDFCCPLFPAKDCLCVDWSVCDFNSREELIWENKLSR